MKQSQLQNHEGKAENSRLGNTPPHFQLFPRSVFHVKPQLIFQAVIHIEASKSHKHTQTNCPNSNTPTFHVKHQASATNRGKATHPKRYLLQLNHEAYSAAGNSIHANGEHIERRYHLAYFSKPPGNGHMHQYVEKLNHFSQRLKLPCST